MSDASTIRQAKEVARAFQIDRTYREGVGWLAQNTEHGNPSMDGIRLLAYLTDTAEEWVLQEVGILQDAIAANDRKVQTAASEAA